MTAKDDNGYLMSWEDSADRVPVLWLHGYPLNNTLWDDQVFDLADIARLITPDLRGHGQSEATSPPYNMGQLADDCVRLLDHLGVTGPVVVAGLSMGGYLAFELARRHPGRVAGLILAATRAGPDGEAARQARDEAAALARAEGVAAVCDAMLPKLLAPGTYDADPELVEFVGRMMAETSLDGMVGALAAMRDREDSGPLLPKLKVPTLVIHGEEDQLIPVAEAKAMAAAIPGAELVIVPGAGHLPNLEQADAFNESVRDFLVEAFYGEEGDD